MSDLINNLDNSSKILPFKLGPRDAAYAPNADSETPVSDQILAVGQALDKKSRYPSEFDYSAYRDLELRYQEKKILGGNIMKTVFRLANSHSTCQQCLYSFEIDTYGRGCVHDCAYCYAKSELTVHGYWNNPIPAPIDINIVRKAFYSAFETDKSGKWNDILRKRIPLRIGSMSDSFMWSDRKYKVTQELLKILRFYEYPYIVFTRSDLAAHDDYLKLMDSKLASIQFSISSLNDELNRKIEPGAPSAKRRLQALEKISAAGFWTTVRINPLFPIYPDGYFTNTDFKWVGEVPKFDYSSFEMIDVIAGHGIPSVLVGFGRFSKISMNALEKAVGFNFRQFFIHGNGNDLKWRDYRYSDREIRYYYEELHRRAKRAGIQFTTCYIGNGEGMFWNDQDLWTNKKDCCNAFGRVPAFKSDARQIPFETRLGFTNHKSSMPTSERLHEKLGCRADVDTPSGRSDKEDLRP